MSYFNVAFHASRVQTRLLTLIEANARVISMHFKVRVLEVSSNHMKQICQLLKYELAAANLSTGDSDDEHSATRALRDRKSSTKLNFRDENIPMKS